MADTDTIDVNDEGSVAHWAKKLDTTEQQIRDAAGRVGPRAADVEMDLKGVRSTTNDDRIEQAGPR